MSSCIVGKHAGQTTTLELNGASIAAYLPAASNAPVEQVGYAVMNAPSPLFEVLQEGGC